MSLTITLDLPADVERRLYASTPNLAAVTKEAVLVSLYRQGRLSQPELAAAMGIDRFQTEVLLKRHNVTEDLGTAAEYVDDARELAARLRATK